MDQMERAEMTALRQRCQFLQRQNSRMRDVLLHAPGCAVCRIAWCDEREKLVDRALGRQRQTLHTENPNVRP